MEWSIELDDNAVLELLDSVNRGRMYPGGRRSLNEQVIARIGNAKIEIFSNEHPPPHFRVELGGDTANFSIKDCTKLNGDLDHWKYNIEDWHAKNKLLLIKKWNSSRPTNCPVGPYVE